LIWVINRISPLARSSSFRWWHWLYSKRWLHDSEAGNHGSYYVDGKGDLWKGEYYFDRNVEILGIEYIVCYAPFYQDSIDTWPVGMVFVYLRIVGFICDKYI